jgi:sugar phosphate isomerase/epimerase
MQLGLVTYNWGADWDLPTILKNLRLTGFEGVELRSTHKHGVEPSIDEKARKDVAKQFNDSGIQLAGFGSACEYHSPDPAVVKKNIEETKAFIHLAHDCGGGGVKVRPNGLPKDVPVAKTLEQIGKAMREVAEYGDGYGVQIRLEVHGNGTQMVPHIKTIMDVADHPNATVCWNCNPTDMDGAGLEQNFNLVKDKLGTIHIHDLISSYPWPELFKLLKQAKFDGWTLLEEGSHTTDPIRVMKYYRLVWNQLAGEG